LASVYPLLIFIEVFHSLLF